MLASSPSGGVPSGVSAFPVRYFDGVLQYVEADLWSDGFGGSWGISRMWSNKPAYSVGGLFGPGWSDGFQPFILVTPDKEIAVVVLNGMTAIYFDKNPFSNEYEVRQFGREKLTVASGDIFTLTTPAGSRIEFAAAVANGTDALLGRFQQLVDADGTNTTVTARNASGCRWKCSVR